MPQRNAANGLHLDVRERGTLCFGKAAHLCLGEADVLEHGAGHRRDDAVDLHLVEAEALTFPPVETRRPLLHRRIAALCDVRDDLHDRLGDRA